MQHSEKVSKTSIPNATKTRQPASSHRSAAGHAVRQATPLPLMFRVAKPKPRNPNTTHTQNLFARDQSGGNADSTQESSGAGPPRLGTPAECLVLRFKDLKP